MKHTLSAIAVGAGLCMLAVAPSFAAVDAKYFEKQSCKELAEELSALRKAETTINDAMKKKDSEADIKTAVGFLLTGWPFWGKADHGNANAQLAEIRDDIRYVRASQKSNKCAA